MRRRGLSRATAASAILLLLISCYCYCSAEVEGTVHSSALRIDKCCRSGEILVLEETGEFACTRKSETAQELLDPREESPGGIPTCGESGYLEQRLLEEITDRLPHDACLEIFYDPTTRQDFPVIVYCNYVTPPQSQSRLAYSLEELPETPRIPQIYNFRKCCPGNDSVYDVKEKYCVPAEAGFRLVFERLHDVDFVDVYSGPPSCQYALVDYNIHAADIYNDGTGISVSIPLDGRTRNVTIDMENACLDAEASSSFIVARLCSEADYCLANPCIRKCCPENKINTKCSAPPENVSLENFRTSLMALVLANDSDLPKFDIKNYGLVLGRPCDIMYSLEPEEEWEIGSHGEFIVTDYATFNYVNSCIEYMHNHPDFENGIYPFYCFEDNVYYASHAKFDITAGLALTSCGFLLVTLLVYICLPSLQNLHGKTLMCHVASLFFAFGCLGVTGILTHRVLDDIDESVENIVCTFLGYSIVFCFHSAFFWLNVMCFDIWWTFGGMQGTVSPETKRRLQRNRFLAYCAYAWGLAFVVTGISALLEHLDILDAAIGRERCWFESRSIAEVVFFIAPISITLLINTVFFIITSYRCSKVKAEIKRVMANVKDPTARKFHSDKTRLIMNVKLFIVMGIPWILENIPAYLNHYQQLPVWIQEIFFVADVINSLQGLWIFVLFVLKPKVYRALRKRFGAGRRNKGSNNTTLNVQGQLHPVRKSASNSTLMSNFIGSSTTT